MEQLILGLCHYLKFLFLFESVWFKKSRGDTIEIRSYISRHWAEARWLNEKTRKPRLIENNLHVILNAIFGEDASKKRKGQDPVNCIIMLKTVLTLLENNQAK